MRKAILTGAIGGLVGTWAMSEAQRAWTHAIDGEAPESAAGKHDARDWQERSEGQNSNEIAAQAVATRVIGRRLDQGELAVSAAVMHYTFGAAVGALYGAYAERRTRGRRALGSDWRSGCSPTRSRCRCSASPIRRCAGRSKSGCNPSPHTSSSG